eukprot:COSAG04_NODE_29764_length_267_cov_0.577381_2_plen_60_part_01
MNSGVNAHMHNSGFVDVRLGANLEAGSVVHRALVHHERPRLAMAGWLLSAVVPAKRRYLD